MSNYGEIFISAVIDRNDVHAFDRYGITRELFATEAERRAYDFVIDYAEHNGGKLPDYRTLEAEIDNFVYFPQSQDTFRHMADEIKEYAGKQMISEYWNSDEIARMFNTLDTDEFTERVLQRFEDIRKQTATSTNIGFDIGRDSDQIIEEYKRRKEGKSFKLWESLFPKMNAEIGGYYSSNMYVWFGRSGRGKSVITMMEAIYAAMQGAIVMIWSLEMGTYELATRMIAAISAMKKLFKIDVNGQMVGAGFDTKAIMSGKMDSDFEVQFIEFVQQLNTVIDGRIIIRAIDEEGFNQRNVRGLISDVKTVGADVVVVDPIYYMQMEKNESRTSGGDVAATSKALRLLAGRLQIVLHVITQADEVSDETGEDGNREIRLPKRGELSKAKQILQDSTNTFAIDTCGGRGVISLEKGRSGGEDTEIEIIYLPQYGIVHEIDSAAAAEMFAPIGDVSGGGSEVF